MTPDTARHPRMQHVTNTGTALAVVLLPLAAGMLLAKAMGSDPLTSVNAMIAHSGQRARVSPSQWRGCGRYALRGREATARRAALRTRAAAACRSATRTDRSTAATSAGAEENLSPVQGV
ncbi:hypothetical protein ACFYXH_21390 [Streptomyces sp. NPDC002730]|uniref:hypothetical protein n=1 Tax=Streptomyces sp. NPDC002730 TaxID=3364662 RepID=UPI00368EB7A4